MVTINTTVSVRQFYDYYQPVKPGILAQSFKKLDSGNLSEFNSH